MSFSFSISTRLSLIQALQSRNHPVFDSGRYRMAGGGTRRKWYSPGHVHPGGVVFMVDVIRADVTDVDA
jgi:hypothetical protein